MHFPLAQIDGSDAAGTVTAVLFYLFALMTGGSALLVVVSRNIVRMSVALLFTLTGVAGLYFLLNAEFLAAVQIVVYAGGTLILIVFGVMLTSKSPFSRFEPKLGEVVTAVSLAAIVLFALVLGVLKTSFTGAAGNGDGGDGAGGLVAEEGGYPVDRLGQVLLGDYLVPFEVVSVLLLAVMIGAAYLAKGRRHEGEGAGEATMSRQAREWS
ncbi:MAG TPA: NADH-quinone oxidoreductase subunit J [Tepidisphaeraceae bacterium]|nr:NADH-quinone oxidoreductase subunit J [Tepidisphaeraceae bacterium]